MDRGRVISIDISIGASHNRVEHREAPARTYFSEIKPKTNNKSYAILYNRFTPVVLGSRSKVQRLQSESLKAIYDKANLKVVA